MTKSKIEDEIDGLFRLPLAEFTGARNALAARLRKEGRRNDADRVKLLAKPSVSAWAVNQLYWDHREAMDKLIATGKRLRRDSLDARRDALTNLSELATEVLRDAGHNPSLDTIRRIVTTLESVSAYALLSDGPTPGRLTQDVDPPSFESLAPFMSGIGPSKVERPKPKPAGEVRRIEEFRREKTDTAKAALQDAKKSLARANAEAKEADKRKREAAERLRQATTASDEATRALEDAKRTVENATKALEALLREPAV